MSLLFDAIKKTSSIKADHSDDVSSENSRPGIDLNLDLVPSQPDKNPEEKFHSARKHNNTSDNFLKLPVNSKKLLLTFIKESNLHSQRERFIRTIGAAIFISFILIYSGVYFFIQSTETNHEFYLSHNDIPSNKTNHTDNPNIITSKIKKPLQKLVLSKNTTSSIESIRPEKTLRIDNTQPKHSNTTLINTNTKNLAIHISQAIKPDPVDLLLNDAYSLFHQNEYRLSEKKYKAVLLREPKNRDALLGLAAIAKKDKQYEFAHQKYQYLLHLNPKDSVAVAGLSNIKQQINMEINASQLKFMLKQKPNSAHLYFALGSQYSAQKKWPEAQSAYFSAWSAENNNADFCYNLAVSLDHLNKKKLAINYYRHSLKLDEISAGNFSRSDTKNRISTLQAALK